MAYRKKQRGVRFYKLHAEIQFLRGDYVAVLSGNTDLLEKAKLDKKITALESERKNFLRERDSANGKLAEIQNSVAFHSGKVQEAKHDLAVFESRVERDAEGNPINKIVINGVDDGADVKAIAKRLQEIEEKARTQGEYQKIGEVYGFPILVKTESSSKDLFQMSVNRFFVRGEGGILYTHNNGKLASDPKLACLNFISALEKMPKVIESHEKEQAKATTNIEVYTAIASGSWKKEDELRSLKGQAAELDRKIALTLSPPEPEKEESQDTKRGQAVNTHSHNDRLGAGFAQGAKWETSSEDKSLASKVVFSRPKFR